MPSGESRQLLANMFTGDFRPGPVPSPKLSTYLVCVDSAGFPVGTFRIVHTYPQDSVIHNCLLTVLMLIMESYGEEECIPEEKAV